MSRRGCWRGLAIAGVMLLTLTHAAQAQITTGTLTGSVKDSQGGVVPGASVSLTSATRGTKGPEVVTSSTGTFTFVNLAPDTYTVQVTLTGFKTASVSGLSVSPGDRLAVPAITLEVGGLDETVRVVADMTLIQAQSAERSYTVTTESVQALPIANRSFTGLGALAPGVVGTNTGQQGDSAVARLGGGGSNNIMMDGVSTMDTGSNSPLIQMNVESIAEVKVLVSNYQAEYGRASGLQITAVTKSGSNRFHGSVYDVERNSDWNSNSMVNKLNGNPKTVSKERDWGYSIGGPVGKPGGNNKIFFFYSHEFSPRTAGKDVQRFRMPTAKERQGDFSESTDNNGALFPYIRDAASGLPCTPPSGNTAAVTTGCFADGGSLGKIPQDRLYSQGLAVLNMFPMPNLDPGLAYNYEITRPEEKLRSWSPAIRVDYQGSSSFRASFKYSGFGQQDKTLNGTIPGWNDTKMQKPVVSTFAATANYTLNQTTFFEATVGKSQNELAGCALAQASTGPTFCTNALGMSQTLNLQNIGLANFPMIYESSRFVDPQFYAYGVLNDVSPAVWDAPAGRLLVLPTFSWGNRVANTPPNAPFPGYLNINRTWDTSISMTKVMGRHTIKAGFYYTNSYKAQQGGGNGWRGTLDFGQNTNNPLDSNFGLSNAALGIYNQYTQNSKYVEANILYTNTEGYIQDNWKMTPRITFDYGLRLIHQQPAYDKLSQGSNFFPERYNATQAPSMYTAACANGAVSCTGTNRQAFNPVTKLLMGPTSSNLIGTLVPNTGNVINGLVKQGDGIAQEAYTYPALGFAPRVGVAYDVDGSQRLVLRGGGGLFFDRPGAAACEHCNNPPNAFTVTQQFSDLRLIGAPGVVQAAGAPALNSFKYDLGLPSSTQWNAEAQMLLPWASALSVAYTGQHSYNTTQNVNLNAFDTGSAFRPELNDPTAAASTTGSQSYVSTSPNLVRPYLGYGNIQWAWDRGWRTYHSLQFSFNRRLTNGFSFGFNETLTLSDHQSQGARLQHNADGTFDLRADQGELENLLGQTIDQRHVMKGNFVWMMPRLESDQSALRAVGWVINDWQLSGVWTGTSATPYSVGFSYQGGTNNLNLTGSPDFAPRILVVGDAGAGCNNENRHVQYNTDAFDAPQVNRTGVGVGLESGNDYLRGCFQSKFDLSLARNINLSGGKTIQLRLDAFNAFNQAIITGRNTNMQVQSPTDQSTIINYPFDASGNVLPNRVRPADAGFGQATGWQNPRVIQAQVRFAF